VDAYEDTAYGTFEIQRKTLTRADIAPTLVATYNGAAQPLVVAAAGKLTNLGDVSVSYDGGAEVPVNAGTYKVSVKVTATEVSNFKIVPEDTVFALGEYTIRKKTATKADLVYDQTKLTPDSVLLADAARGTGIGGVSLKAGTDFGTLTVLYAGKEVIPTTVGRYAVTVRISGGSNFYAAVIQLGDYKVVSKISVAQSSREVPSSVTVTEASVAPVKSLAATFTAGPSPASTEIKFFSAKQVTSGSLYIFDASGNAVARVSVNGAGKIGGWNLKDRHGVAVADGTYVVKGALVGKDGTREKVSFVFSVVK